MKNFLNSLRHHIASYKIFYATATFSLGPLWKNLKIYGLFWADKFSLLYWFDGYDVTIIFAILSVVLKNTKLCPILISRLVLFATLVAQAILVTYFSKYIFYVNTILIIFIISIVIYGFWVMVYFLVGGTGLIDKHQRLTKEGGVFFIAMIISLYLTKYLPIILTNYQSSIISITKSRFLLSIWTPAIGSIIVTAVVFFVFLFIYSITKEKLYSKQGGDVHAH